MAKDIIITPASGEITFLENGIQIGRFHQSGSDIYLSTSGSLYMGDGTPSNLQLGDITTSVDIEFLGGGTITPNAGTLNLGVAGDTINLNVAGVTYQLPTHGHSISEITNLQTTLNTYATTGYVSTQIGLAIANLIDSAPGTLDTLNELAAALGDDPNFATTITNALAGKLSTSGKAADSNLLDGIDSTGFMRAANANGYYGLARPSDGDTSDWIRTTANGLIPYTSGGYSSLGTSSWPFNTIYGSIIYENNTALSSKYLGISATASNSNQLLGSTWTSTDKTVRWSSGTGYHGNPRSMAIGYSGGNYGQFGYGLDFTGTSGVHTYAIADVATRVDMYGGLVVYGAPSGTVGTNISWTETFRARYTDTAPTFKGNTIWHAGNDGSGSGLDADTLDGIDSASFLRSDAADTFSAILTGTATGENLKIGGIRGTTKGSQTGEYIHLYERVHIGGPSGWGAATHGAPSQGLSVWGSVDFGMNGTGVIQLDGTTILTAGRQLTNVSGNISMFTNDSGYITGYTETDTLATVTARGASTSSDLTLSGRVTFNSAVVDRPQMPGGFLGIDTGDSNFDIWGISRDYYPSHATAANAWGLEWYGDGNQFRFVGNGTRVITLDMDNGNIVTNGTLSASGYNKSNWDTAYGWGNHASAGYIATSYLDDYTRGSYRVISDYNGQNTWYIRSSGQFIWGNAHDWTQSFRLNLSHNNTDNGSWAYFGQQDSNITNGRYRGVRIRKYASGAVDGDLSAGAYYIGDTRKDTNWDTAYSWGNHAGLYATASHTHDDRYFTETESDTRYMRADTDANTAGAIRINGSYSYGTYTAASNYKTGADNLVLKGNASGVSGIFFESEKDGTNINHPSDFAFIQYSAYGTGTSGESNELIIGVSNDSDDHLILNAPDVNGLKFRTGASTTDNTVYHSGNLTLATLGYTGATNANYITNNNQLTNGAGYITSSGSISGNAATATLASTVTINYNNNSNSTYQMLWGSGTSVYGTASVYLNPSTNYVYASSFNAGDWFRSSGATGWYNGSYGGGIYMSDGTWVRVYNNKQFLAENIIQSNTAIYAPIFYDTNNTNYFVDPASTSNLNTLYTNTLYVNGIDYINYSNGIHSGSDFVDGTLVKTTIDASGTNGSSFIMEVTGKSYVTSHSPFDLILQGYIYNNTFIATSAISNGTSFPGPIQILEYNGELCFWWPRWGYWNSFNVKVRDANGNNRNQAYYIGNSTEPASSKKVAVTPFQSWTTYNFSQSSVNNWNTAYGWGNHNSAGYAPLASPALTGTPTAPTASAATNNTQIATTAYVTTAITNLIGGAPGALDTLNELAAAINDDASYASTITTALGTKAPLASPALTGTPTAPTAAAATNNTQIATTAFVKSQGYLTSLGFNYGTGVTANFVVQRDANGYIYGNHINLSSSETENPTIGTFFVSNGDGWTRKATVAHVKSQLGLGSAAYTASTDYAASSHNHDGVYLPVGGKAADSNLLDGLDLHTGRNNEANKVVRTDGNGYIQAGWINTTSGDNGTTGISRIYASHDGYIRYYTPANFISQLGLITTSNIGSQSVSYATTAGSASTASSSPLLSALGDYVFNASTNGRSFSRGLQTSFVSSSQGYPEYGSVVRIATYSGLNDGGTAELYFPYGASYGGSSMRYRLGLYNNAGWTGWKTVVDSDNIGSQSVNYATTAGTASAVAWGNITSVPSTFTPSAHNQAWSTITGTPTTLAGYGITDALGTSTSGSISFTGNSTIRKIFIDRGASAASGISWYSSGFTSWATYMGSAGQTGLGATGNITAPSGTYVTSWALRNFIENTSGYGWTWEAGTYNGQPSIVAELSSSSGNFRTVGTIYASGGNSSEWNSAYSERYRWDGGASGINAATGRASLGLGTAATSNTGDFAAASHTHTFASLTSKPTTISGYGITDAITTGNIGSQSVSYASASGTAGTSLSTSRGIIEDTRSAQRTPNDYDDYRVSFEFTNQMPHDSNWLSIMTMQGWSNGYNAWQIQGPATSSDQNAWYLRSGRNTTWGTANLIIHSGNISSQSVNYANSAGSATNADTVDSLHASSFLRSDTTNGVYRVTAGDGNRIQFWDSTNYAIWMSSTGNSTWGGRLDTTSDYNMYFRMSGGTNRGFVFKNSTTDVAQIAADGTIYTASHGNSSNWNTAYGWGNHANAGYLTSVPAQSFASLTGKPTTLSGYGITDAATSTHNHDATYLGISATAADSNKLGGIAASSYSQTSHNHTYNVNDAWLRDNGDNANVKLYGNSRQMVFRTDGTTEYASGVGGYPFAWMYGGDASGNRRMLLNNSGQLWLSNYGWLHDYFQAAGSAINTGNIGSQSVEYSNRSLRLQSSIGTWGGAVTFNNFRETGRTRVYDILGYDKATSTNPPATPLQDAAGAGAFNYGTLLSVSGDYAHFEIYMPNNTSNTVHPEFVPYFRTGYQGGWSDWSRLVTSVDNTTTLVGNDGTALVIDSQVGWSQAASAILELNAQSDNWASSSFRFMAKAPDNMGTQLLIDKYTVDGGWINLGYVDKNADNNLYWMTDVIQGFSDNRLKTNVNTLTGALETVSQLRAVTFDWDPEMQEYHRKEGSDLGFIAQEIEEFLPEVVVTRPDGYKTVKYEKVVPVLVEAIKEQQATINALIARIEALENK